MTEKKTKAFVLVDYENVEIPLEKDNKKLDLSKNVFSQIGKKHAEKVEVYIVCNLGNFAQELPNFSKHRYQMINAELSRKNSADITFAVEAISLVHENRDQDVHFIFVCGDADYLPVFNKLELLNTPYTVYSLKSTVGQDFADHFDSSEYGELIYLDDECTHCIMDYQDIDEIHIKVLKELKIAEQKAKDLGSIVRFDIFRNYLMNATAEFTGLTEERAIELIDEVVQMGYVNKIKQQTKAGRSTNVFSVNYANSRVLAKLGE